MGYKSHGMPMRCLAGSRPDLAAVPCDRVSTDRRAASSAHCVRSGDRSRPPVAMHEVPLRFFRNALAMCPGDSQLRLRAQLDCRKHSQLASSLKVERHMICSKCDDMSVHSR